MILEDAKKEAKRLGEPAVKTEDVLLAIFMSMRAQQSESSNYSTNLTKVLKNASLEASKHGEAIIGTEDVLRAMFFSDAFGDYSTSLRAMRFMEDRGISPQLLGGNLKLTSNASLALRAAAYNAENRGHKEVGTEDLLHALFHDTSKDSKARYWMMSNARMGYDQSSRSDLNGSHSPARMFLVGGLAGSIETCITQPSVYWKTVLQRGVPLSLDPRVMYRGVVVNVCSIGPISAVQYGGYASLRNVYNMLIENVDDAADPRKKAQPISLPAELGISALSGVLSAVVVSPAELVMISQQRFGNSLKAAAAEVIRKNGVRGVFRGIVPTAAREGGWTLGFIGIAPSVKEMFMDDSRYFSHHEIQASAAASVVAGQFAATITQPFDTIKTMMQSDRGITEPMRFKNMLEASKALYREHGMSAFFRGLFPRSLRCSAAVFILGQASTVINKEIDHMESITRKKGLP